MRCNVGIIIKIIEAKFINKNIRISCELLYKATPEGVKSIKSDTDVNYIKCQCNTF